MQWKRLVGGFPNLAPTLPTMQQIQISVLGGGVVLTNVEMPRLILTSL